VRACTSSNSRTFSIAITAWSAKVVTSSISRSMNGSTRRRASPMTPIGWPSRISGTPIMERILPTFASCFFSYCGSFQASSIRATLRVMAARPTRVPGPGTIGVARSSSR